MTGVHRLYQTGRTGKLLFQAINMNDSVTKSMFDNLSGCQHSLLDGIKHGSALMIGEKTALVLGHRGRPPASRSRRRPRVRRPATAANPALSRFAASDGAPHGSANKQPRMRWPGRQCRTRRLTVSTAWAMRLVCFYSPESLDDASPDQEREKCVRISREKNGSRPLPNLVNITELIPVVRSTWHTWIDCY
jgi:hypothetical protein